MIIALFHFLNDQNLDCPDVHVVFFQTLQLQQLQKNLWRDTAFMMVAIVSFIYHTLVILILMLRY